MPRNRKTKQYQWQTATPKYLECELMKVLSDKEIELSRLKSKEKAMETTIKQLNKKISNKNNLPLLKPQPIMEIKNGIHSLEIYPHSETIKTTIKLRRVIKDFMLLTF